ncbi:hypothetical protein K440DRAFT_619051 [Wilcoxina mikolae CBS 423.85]|nr:hypothetical protein K440DRAFT_619051 [Wilcoxina mikolae CBS 423.85]
MTTSSAKGRQTLNYQPVSNASTLNWGIELRLLSAIGRANFLVILVCPAFGWSTIQITWWGCLSSILKLGISAHVAVTAVIFWMRHFEKKSDVATSR